MRALTLAVLEVLGLDEVGTGVSPLPGELVCVVHMHVDGSAAHPLMIEAGSREMDRELVAMGERISLVVMRGAEAQPLVVCNRQPDIRDHEDWLDTDDATHVNIIGSSQTLHGRFDTLGPTAENRSDFFPRKGRLVCPGTSKGATSRPARASSCARAISLSTMARRTTSAASHSSSIFVKGRSKAQMSAVSRSPQSRIARRS